MGRRVKAYRKEDMIVLSGNELSPAKIEGMLMAEPEILLAHCR